MLEFAFVKSESIYHEFLGPTNNRLH